MGAHIRPRRHRMEVAQEAADGVAEHDEAIGIVERILPGGKLDRCRFSGGNKLNYLVEAEKGAGNDNDKDTREPAGSGAFLP